MADIAGVVAVDSDMFDEEQNTQQKQADCCCNHWLKKSNHYWQLEQDTVEMESELKSDTKDMKVDWNMKIQEESKDEPAETLLTVDLNHGQDTDCKNCMIGLQLKQKEDTLEQVVLEE